jgi:antitoxin VapB
MGVIIKKPAAERKIRKLAKRTGETLTEAVERAVDERLARLPQVRKGGHIDRKKLTQILTYFNSLPNANEDLSDDEIIGYDQRGLPR